MQADAADGRRGQDALAVGLVVERDVAGDDGEGERAAGLRQALDGLHELAHDLGPLGIAEVEVVGDGDGVGAHGREVAPAFGHRLLAALEGVGLDIARRHVGRDRDRLLAADAHHARIAAGDLRGVGADEAVILLPHPAPRAHVGRADDLQDRGLADRSARARPSAPACFFGSTHGRSYSGASSPICLMGRSAITSPWCLMTKRSVSVVLPTMAKSSPHLWKMASASFSLSGSQHHEHALLAFRQHHLIGGHARLRGTAPGRDRVRCRGRPWRPSRRRSEVRPAAPMSWMAMTAPRRHQFEAGFEQALLGEGVAHLHGRALLLGLVVEFGRRHGGAVDAVAPRLGAEIDDGKAHALGLGIEDRVGRAQGPPPWR